MVKKINRFKCRRKLVLDHLSKSAEPAYSPPARFQQQQSTPGNSREFFVEGQNNKEKIPIK
jgi:hypothetical protein